LIIVFSEVDAQTGTARLRVVVKQERREAAVSLKAHQRKKDTIRRLFYVGAV